jgi:hypothetical protein
MSIERAGGAQRSSESVAQRPAVSLEGQEQQPRVDRTHMTDRRHADDAMDLAIERTVQAEKIFEVTPVEDPRAIAAADVVVLRADDVHALARDDAPATSTKRRHGWHFVPATVEGLRLGIVAICAECGAIRSHTAIVEKRDRIDLSGDCPEDIRPA